MIRVTFLDGTFLDVSSETTFVGINNVPNQNNKECFYLTQAYRWANDEGASLSTCDNRFGIAGFLLSFDCFALSDKANETIYMKSAVKSVSVI